MPDYVLGRQPCDTFNGELDGFGLTNVHQCPRCHGLRSFCLNCNRDHHDGGWDTCREDMQEINDAKYA